MVNCCWVLFWEKAASNTAVFLGLWREGAEMGRVRSVGSQPRPGL